MPSEIRKAAAMFTTTPGVMQAGPGGLLAHIESAGATWTMGSIAHYFGNEGVTKTADAIEQARNAGVPWANIFGVILPLILQLFSGGGISLQAIIDAIKALITKP